MIGRSDGKEYTMQRLPASVLACLLTVSTACASEDLAPVPAGVSPGIPALIKQLGADDYPAREEASFKLSRLGLEALPALREAARSENPEIRERAAVLVRNIQPLAESGRIIAKRLKLSYKNTPLGVAFNDLKARTGLNLVLDPNRVENPLRQVTCETAEVPVWEALEAFCVAAGLRETFLSELESPKSQQNIRRGMVSPPPAPGPDTIPVTLVDGKPDRLPGDRSTAVRVMVLPPNFSGHKVTLGTGEINLCLDVTPAPSAGWRAGAVSWQEVTGVRVSRVIDSSGRSGGAGSELVLPPPAFDPNLGQVFPVRPGVVMRIDNMGNFILPGSLPNPRVVNVPIRVATSAATSLKRLEGMVFADFYSLENHLISISDLKRNTNTVMNGPGEVKATVQEAKEASKEGEVGVVRVLLEYPSQYTLSARKGVMMFNFGFPDPPRHPSLGYRVVPYDAAGKPMTPIPAGSTSTIDSSDDGSSTQQMFNLSFTPKQGLPAKLLVVGPKSVSVQIPFSLENVPLP